MLEEKVPHDARYDWKFVFECVCGRRENGFGVWVFTGVLGGKIRVRAIVVTKLREELVELHGYPLDIRAVLVSGGMDGFDHDLDIARLFREV